MKRVNICSPVCMGFLITGVLAVGPCQTLKAGIISDILDYQLMGAQFPVQYLFDDTLRNPEFMQVFQPITVVPNPGIAAPREVWLMRPGQDMDANPADPSRVSDIVAIRPVAGGFLQLLFWSDDNTVTKAQFEAQYGLPGVPVATIVEDGLAHDVNGLLFAQGSPFQHVIVASDLLDVGILPGIPGTGQSGGIPISETLAFRAKDRILNQGMHGAAFYNQAGMPESDLLVFMAGVNGNVFQNTYIAFTEGLHPDMADQMNFMSVCAPTNNPEIMGPQPVTDILAMRVDGDTLKFGVWSEVPNQTSDDFLKAFFGAAIPLKPADCFDETKEHDDPIKLFGLTGKQITVNGTQTTIDSIDFKSDPPVPEPSTVYLVGSSIGLLAIALRRRLRQT